MIFFPVSHTHRTTTTTTTTTSKPWSPEKILYLGGNLKNFEKKKLKKKIEKSSKVEIFTMVKIQNIF